MSRDRLRAIVQTLPLDRIQRQAAEEGISELDDKTADEIAADLEAALDELPSAVAKLEAALAELDRTK